MGGGGQQQQRESEPKQQVTAWRRHAETRSSDSSARLLDVASRHGVESSQESMRSDVSASQASLLANLLRTCKRTVLFCTVLHEIMEFT